MPIDPRVAVDATYPDRPDRWDETSAGARRARRRLHTEQQGPLPAGVFARVAPLCDPPQFLSADIAGRVLAVARIAADVHRMTLVLPIGALDPFQSSFTCTLVGDDGSPLAGARASATRRGWSGAAGTTDDTGRVRCVGLLSGQWMITVSAEDRARAVRFVDLPPGKELDLGTITLGASLHVRGRFVDAEGRPLVGRNIGELAHEVVVLPCSAEDPSGSGMYSGASQFVGKTDGTFEGTRFGRERYLIKSSRTVPVSGANRVIRPTVVDCTGGSVDELIVTTDRAYPVTLRPEVDEAKDFGYAVLDASENRVERGDLVEGRTWFLPSGDYRLLVGPDPAHTKEIPFTV